MATGRPDEVVSVNPLGVLLSSGMVLAAVVAGVVGLFGGGLVGSLVGVDTPVAVAVTFVVGLAVLAGLLVMVAAGREVRFHDDCVELTTGRWGRGGAVIPYEEVDLVVRKTSLSDRLRGTGSLEFLHGGETTGVWFLRDPDAAERILNERVRSPAEQFRATGDDRYDTIWRGWPEHADPPSDPVVEAGTLERTLGDVDYEDLPTRGLPESGDGTGTPDGEHTREPAGFEGDGEHGGTSPGSGGERGESDPESGESR